MRQPYRLELYGETFWVVFKKDRYTNNQNLYIGLDCEDELFADVTVNVMKQDDPYVTCIDTNNLGDGILDWLEDIGAGKRTWGFIPSGFYDYPVFRFNEDFINKIK